jgi:hypothetical protein
VKEDQGLDARFRNSYPFLKSQGVIDGQQRIIPNFGDEKTMKDDK